MITYYLSSLENDNCCVNEIITSVLYCLSRDYTETLYLLLIFSQEWRICYRKYLGRQTQRYSESRQEMIKNFLYIVWGCVLLDVYWMGVVVCLGVYCRSVFCFVPNRMIEPCNTSLSRMATTVIYWLLATDLHCIIWENQ